MDNNFYSSERNTQILVSLLKAHNVKRIIVSPGSTNINFVACIQNDPFFQIYSCVDERSAAYMACGMAAESMEPVALSCTGATSSRNYVPGLTEAYYRKLPIVAITSAQHLGRIGQMVPQVIDRSVIMNDIARLSITVPAINNKDDEWACEVSINRALIALKRHPRGPVHINLVTTYNQDFSLRNLPAVRKISLFDNNDELPELKAKRIGIFVGAHLRWSDHLTELVDNFCDKYNAVVLCDHTSNYHGKFRVLAALACYQSQYIPSCCCFDILIHLGEISGAYFKLFPKYVWRVTPDGEVQDPFKRLQFVFDMTEEDFFSKYLSISQNTGKNSFLEEWKTELKKLIDKIPELPFSNPWIAQQTISRLPSNSTLHLGILNSLRSWNFFDGDKTLSGFSNTGGFGIDGGVSSFIGASLVDDSRLFFAVVGDLAFFYDMNSIGNRHVGSNVRILVINNGKGTEFRNFDNLAYKFGDQADNYMAAAGHFGNKSISLLRHYSEDLHFEYLHASTKEEFLEVLPKFVNPKIGDRPIFFEVFTDSKLENLALKTLSTLEVSTQGAVKAKAKEILGPKNIQTLKNLLRR